MLHTFIPKGLFSFPFHSTTGFQKFTKTYHSISPGCKLDEPVSVARKIACFTLNALAILILFPPFLPSTTGFQKITQTYQSRL